jgi:PleD family two-component response regulator
MRIYASDGSIRKPEVNTPSHEALDRPRVVVVNSEAEFLIVVRELLETEGYDVFTMHVDESPFDQIIKIDPAVVAIDFVYEKPDAWNLLARLDDDARTRNIPLLVTSTDELIVEQIKKLSTHRSQMFVLIKPLELDAMVDAVNRLLGR